MHSIDVWVDKGLVWDPCLKSYVYKYSPSSDIQMIMESKIEDKVFYGLKVVLEFNLYIVQIWSKVFFSVVSVKLKVKQIKI